MARKLTSSAVEIIRRDLEKNPVLAALVEEERKALKLADKIYEARQALGMTQKELAKRTGTTQSVISRIESGEYERFTISTLIKLSIALNRKPNIDLVEV